MSKYTITLRNLCSLHGRETVENWFKDYDLSDYLMPDQLNQIEKFGIWTKDKLATKIVDHYYFREIGFETDEIFKHYVKATMREIMQRYSLKIYTLFLEFDPLSNVDYIETYTKNITGTANSTTNSNNSGLTINSDTPQGQTSKAKILEGKYASSASTGESESNVNDNASTNTVETYTHRMQGDNGVIITNQRLVKEFRENIILIDEEIINELNSLFMGIY